MVSRAPDPPVRSADRRFAPRAPSELSVRLGTSPMLAEARSVDISMGGVLLSRNRPLSSTDTDSYLDVLVQLPSDPEPIRAVARTVWWWGPYHALRFLKMSEPDRLRLAEHIDRVSSSRGRA